MKGILSWLVRWALHASTEDFYPALAALVSPVQNIFNLCVPIAQQPGQAVVQGRLFSECVSPVNLNTQTQGWG
jgi:hypothetical protein